MKIKKYQYGKHQQDCVYDPSGIAPTVAAGTHGSGPHLLKILVSKNAKVKDVPNKKTNLKHKKFKLIKQWTVSIWPVRIGGVK